jgi:hypothetical protein
LVLVSKSNLVFDFFAVGRLFRFWVHHRHRHRLLAFAHVAGRWPSRRPIYPGPRGRRRSVVRR